MYRNPAKLLKQKKLSALLRSLMFLLSIDNLTNDQKYQNVAAKDDYGEVDKSEEDIEIQFLAL